MIITARDWAPKNKERKGKGRHFEISIRLDYPMPVICFELNSRTSLKILGLPNEMCNNFRGVLKIRYRHDIFSFGQPEIHYIS